jgi:hypothetical protein
VKCQDWRAGSVRDQGRIKVGPGLKSLGFLKKMKEAGLYDAEYTGDDAG